MKELGHPASSQHLRAPTLGSLTTPNGADPAVVFNGALGVALNDGNSLNLQTISTFVVASLNGSQEQVLPNRPRYQRLGVGDMRYRCQQYEVVQR